eukprot:snap_masked-scaffold_14-processed-gene-9.14-mRNA-1 protein AED:1.00 eAED:1.00 QI:0/0/0/0/1/1/2/0/63
MQIHTQKTNYKINPIPRHNPGEKYLPHDISGETRVSLSKALEEANSEPIKGDIHISPAITIIH